MSLKGQIQRDLTLALKQGDQARRGVLRMLKSKILEAEVELRSKKGRDYELNDEEVLDVIARYAKQRTQSIEAYESAGRQDLADRERQELDILRGYLPRQLSEQEIEEIARQLIDELGATSQRDLGKVMGAIMSRVKGSADGKVVREVVQRLLS